MFSIVFARLVVVVAVVFATAGSVSANPTRVVANNNRAPALGGSHLKRGAHTGRSLKQFDMRNAPPTRVRRQVNSALALAFAAPAPPAQNNAAPQAAQSENLGTAATNELTTSAEAMVENARNTANDLTASANTVVENAGTDVNGLTTSANRIVQDGDNNLNSLSTSTNAILENASNTVGDVATADSAAIVETVDNTVDAAVPVVDAVTGATSVVDNQGNAALETVEDAVAAIDVAARDVDLPTADELKELKATEVKAAQLKANLVDES